MTAEDSSCWFGCGSFAFGLRLNICNLQTKINNSTLTNTAPKQPTTQTQNNTKQHNPLTKQHTLVTSTLVFVAVVENVVVKIVVL